MASVLVLGCLACAGGGGDASPVFALVIFAVCALVTALELRPERLELMPTDGLCVVCRYDLAGLGAVGLCPECGSSFPRPRAVVTRTLVVLERRRGAMVLAAAGLMLLGATVPWLWSADGAMLRFEDLGWARRAAEAGVPDDAIRVMLSNRARARAGDLSALGALMMMMSFSPGWAWLGSRRWAMRMLLGHLLLAELALLMACG